MKKIIINADDFGMSDSVNNAILNSFEKKLISSTTLLPNMDGFQQAIQIAKNCDYFNNAIGIHLNLFEGKPLTERIQNSEIFCNKEKYFNEKNISFLEPKKELELVYEELEAQIQKVLDNGIIPTHIDSHVHRHTNYFIGKAVIDLAKKYKIPCIRLTSNTRNCKIQKKIFIKVYNGRLRMHGIKTTNFFGNIPEISEKIDTLSGIVEIMVHPTFNQNNCLIDAEFPQSLSDLLLPFSGYTKISFGELI